jgi:hypothetical protein
LKNQHINLRNEHQKNPEGNFLFGSRSEVQDAKTTTGGHGASNKTEAARQAYYISSTYE